MTSTVICQNCGENVVWYNKFGKMDNTDSIITANEIEETESIEDVLHEIFKDEDYIEDGSGD